MTQTTDYATLTPNVIQMNIFCPGTETTDTTCATCDDSNDMWLDTSVDAVGVCTINLVKVLQTLGAMTAPTCTVQCGRISRPMEKQMI